MLTPKNMTNEGKSPVVIIEAPQRDFILPQELANILGGWNCGSYSKRLLLKDKCKEWDKSPCSKTREVDNYCGKYSSSLRKNQ